MRDYIRTTFLLAKRQMKLCLNNNYELTFMINE